MNKNSWLLLGKMLLFLVLLPVALIFILILSVVTFMLLLFNLIVNKENKNIGEIITSTTMFVKAIDLSLDQLGNVVLKKILNTHFLYYDDDNVHLFGDPDETISEVIGINMLVGTLKETWLQVFLDNIDKNHCKKAFLSSYDKSLYKVNKYKSLYNSERKM